MLPDNIVDGTNVFGQTLHLPDYLKFGIVVGTEAEVLAATQNREDARSYADTALNNYDEPANSDTKSAAPIVIAVVAVAAIVAVAVVILAKKQVPLSLDVREIFYAEIAKKVLNSDEIYGKL